MGDATAVTATVVAKQSLIQINGQVPKSTCLKIKHLRNLVKLSTLNSPRSDKGANLSAYIVNGEIKVPNTAQYLINNAEFKTASNSPVTVTHHLKRREVIEKTVNDKQAETLWKTQESPPFT